MRLGEDAFQWHGVGGISFEHLFAFTDIQGVKETVMMLLLSHTTYKSHMSVQDQLTCDVDDRDHKLA